MSDLRSPTRRVVLAAASLAGAAAFAGPVGAEDRPLRLVAFGDSLTAGYALPPGRGFAPRLEAALRKDGLHVDVIDAGVSGDTTDMGLARLEWSVPADADAVIVELGANDCLRGLPPAEARRNLDAIVARLRGRGQQVLVAGMLAPRNLGAAYVAAFDPIFAEVAAAHGASHYPFFLEGVAMNPDYTLPDGLHPSARGVEVIVERILPAVRDLLARARAARP
ncbi:arylesterase [Siculibacillus lacustris]|uniref:Arylesterase n=1 Tax=Siculibacillus lacustris TaxID=1549641 RepID=A0A4Q9VUS8_9HYPH|nr:arylesterase [Siculibacillus lacustris]TBW39971.1 arylesterase [Siculibacillus lacustris]